MFGTKNLKKKLIAKTIEYKTNEQNIPQNICIEKWKKKFNQVRLVLSVFASTNLALNYIILLTNCKLDAVSKKDKSCYNWFQLAFNNQVVITPSSW